MRLCQLAPCFKATWDSEVQACTEGIWISYSRCGKTIELVLDIEGSGNTQNHTEHDTLLFTLAVLISSCFVYNSKGVIDEAVRRGSSMRDRSPSPEDRLATR